ncbi:hypothetical protein DYB32_003180 [Aphanomyces invadans]|uniref:Uncharacterized protein n=1 Tax=Aphanomyces invadans TaxID=157072 RepID=A0A3R6WPD9_9STRA|nr:hypothetical protein DYB32_003180 [Aphanomyces invadans]
MDRDVRLTHLASMECHAKLVGLGGHVYALQRHPKSAVVAGGIGDQTIRVIDLTKPELSSQLLWKGLQSKVTAHRLTGHGGGITCLDWSASGAFLASASLDGTVQVWKVGHADGFNFREHCGRVLAVTWVDDTKLVSGGEDQTIRKWAFADQVHSMPPKPKPTAEATPISKSTAATPKKKDHKTVVMKAASTMFHQQSGLAADIGNAQPVTDFLRDEQDLYEAASLGTKKSYDLFKSLNIPPGREKWSEAGQFLQSLSLVDQACACKHGSLEPLPSFKLIKELQANATTYCVVKALCRMSLDLVQGNLIGAFEAWSACLEQVTPWTADNNVCVIGFQIEPHVVQGELLKICSLLFPSGVDTTPPLVGELATDPTCTNELWAHFFLFQGVAFSRSLRAAASVKLESEDEDNKRRDMIQGALVFMIQWINELLPASYLVALDASVVHVAQSALNDLSLLYHQLLDGTRTSPSDGLECPVKAETNAVDAV